MTSNSTLATLAAAHSRHKSVWAILVFYLRGGLRHYDIFIPIAVPYFDSFI